MKKIYTLLVTLAILGLQSMSAQTVSSGGNIQAVIDAASPGATITLSSGTYNQNVIVNKSITLESADSTAIIAPSSGIGVVVTASSVTLKNFKVTGAPDHGIYAGNVSNLTIDGVVARGNGSGIARSGIALQNVTTATIMNVTASGNADHGLEIGENSSNVSVTGGKFEYNGVAGDYNTGGGILLYASSGKTVLSTVINGVNANYNKAAGIYLTAVPGGTISSTMIGQTNRVYVHNNGSGTGPDEGGAGVLLYGNCVNTTITATSYKTVANDYAAIIVVGTDENGANSPSGTVVQNCDIKGYAAATAAGTFKVTLGGQTLIGNSDVDATVGNSIDDNGSIPGFDVEKQLLHKMDDLALGMFKGPGVKLFVPAGNTISRAITVAKVVSYGVQQIDIEGGTYAENVVVDKASLTLQGAASGTPTTIDPANGIGIVVTSNSVAVYDVTVTGAPDHGVYAGNVSNLTLTNITANNNGTGNDRSGIALQYVTGTSVLTNITANSNKDHGLEIGDGSTGVVVNGGTFNNNGVAGDYNSGGGILIYAGAGKTTNGTIIKGTITANENTTAGIYITSEPGGTLDGTQIGQAIGSSITANDNGSVNGLFSGGAAVLVYGPCSNTQISANSTRSGSLSYNTAGLVILGTDENGANSPTGTVVSNSSISGFGGASPAGTMYVTNGTIALKCTTNVDATVGNTIDGVASGFPVEDLLTHKMDDYSYGLFVGPGTELFVTPNSASIQRAIDIASNYPALGITKVNVQENASAYNVGTGLNVSVANLTVEGSTTSPYTTVSSYLNVAANGVTVKNLKLAGGASLLSLGYDNVTATNITVQGTAGGDPIYFVHLRGNNITVNNLTGTSLGFTANPTLKNAIRISSPSSNINIIGGSISAASAGVGDGIRVDATTTNITNVNIQDMTISNFLSGIVLTAASGGKLDTVNIGTSSLLDINNNTLRGCFIVGNVTNVTAKNKVTKGTANGVGYYVEENAQGVPANIVLKENIFNGFVSSPNFAVHGVNLTDSVDARDNAWGTIDQTEIANRISGKVKFNPWKGKQATTSLAANTDFTVVVPVSISVGITFDTWLDRPSYPLEFTIRELIFDPTYSVSDYFVTNSIPIPSTLGTVSNEVLEISANFNLPNGAEFEYKIVDRNNFTNNTRVAHYHNNQWVDLGRIQEFRYKSGILKYSVTSISEVPADASEIFAVFVTNGLSTFAFVEPSASAQFLNVSSSSQNQTASVNTAYATNLSVTVTQNDVGVAGVTVYFSRPSSGASVTFNSGTTVGDSVGITTDANGVASVGVTANGTTGAFEITARTASGVSPVTIGLTNTAPSGMLVKAKVFLQGPFSSGSMSVALATASLIPLSQPYNTASFGNYAGTEAVTDAAFLQTNSIVDWVLVELRSTSNGAAIDRRAGLLKNDGTLCNTDGSVGVTFSVATAGDYYIVVKHRNHIPIMSANVVTLPNASAHDFTTAQTQAFGTNPMAALTGGVFGLPAGDVEVNGGIAATDLTAIRNAIGLAVYTPYDVEMNGGVAATDLTATRNNIGFASQLP